MADVNIAGLISIILFYLVILAIGIFAAWVKNKKQKQAETSDEKTNEVILAGKNIGLFIGCFTMTGIDKSQTLVKVQKNRKITNIRLISFQNSIRRIFCLCQ